MKKITKVFIIVSLLVFSTTAFAQIKPGAFNVGPLGGGFLFEGNQDLKNPAPVLGLRGGYDFTKNWGVEAVFNWVPTKYNYSYYYDPHTQGAPGWEEDSAYTFVYNYRFEANYNFDFTPAPRFVPFVAVGIGGQSIDYRGSNKQNRTRFVEHILF